MTINDEVALLTRVLRWAETQGYMVSVPKVENIPVRRVKVDVPSPEEVVRIIDALPERLKPLVWFLAETGCRVSEALNLTWDCVYEVGGYVEIQSREGWTPKTEQSERRIPLAPRLLECIRSLPEEGDLVFPGDDPDKPIGQFKRAFSTAVDKANIRRRRKRIHLTPKVLRKAYASWQAERGIDESLLQELLGHARGSRITRQHYVHAREEAKASAIFELPIGDREGNVPG